MKPKAVKLTRMLQNITQLVKTTVNFIFLVQMDKIKLSELWRKLTFSDTVQKSYQANAHLRSKVRIIS